MSNKVDKIELIKSILKELHRGMSVDELKDKYGELLRNISPFEIPIIEQQLVKDGISVNEILKLCDLHVALFRESLEKKELKDIPKGHPLELLMRENDWIVKYAEILGLYAAQLINSRDVEHMSKILDQILVLTNELRKIRLHYRKVQMLLFAYLERRGIYAIPRVLWGREDQVIVKLREFYRYAVESKSKGDVDMMVKAGELASEVSREIGELVFRENKILYPTLYVLLSDEEWSTILSIADEIGWIVDTSDRVWKPLETKVYPYMIETLLTDEQLAKLPPEVRLRQGDIKADNYVIRREDDIEFETGFLTRDEVEGILKSLPLEVTYANKDHRVRFYSESEMQEGFVRTKTIIGRKLEYCHPPRLESFVNKVADEVLKGEVDKRVFWTKLGDRILRVIIAPVKNRDEEIQGVLEIVEDLTDVIENVDKIKENIMVL